LRVFARRADAAAALLREGALAAESPAALARACDLVFLCVSDDTAVEDVLFGEQGLVEGLAHGSCVVDTSTIAPATARAVGQRLAARGVGFLDAPVSGGQQGAEAGTLACMVGGDAQVLAACEPVMQAFCATITHVGAQGAGQTVKACNQVAVAAAFLGVADAIALARSQGVDPAVMRQVLLGGTARSVALEKHALRVIEGNFEPGFRATLMRKDLRAALAAGAEAGLPLPSTHLVEGLLDALCREGEGERDWSAVARRLTSD
jgi:2-hydroxy-3-oxopropionate reductase